MSTLPQTRILVLQTRDITDDAGLIQNIIQGPFSNGVGEADKNITQVTWKNVDLLQLIGQEMWDTYAKFNLVLSSFSLCSGQFGSMDPVEKYNDRSIFITMEGPGWVNAYATSSRSYTNEVVVGLYSSASTTSVLGVVQYYNGAFIVTFDKSRRHVDITVRLRRTCDAQLQILDSQGAGDDPSNNPDWSLAFNIFPCSDARMTDATVVAR